MVGALWYAERSGQPSEPGPALGEAELNTIGYVLSRYGALTGRDLGHLTHSETPWRLADAGRRPGTSVRIETAWIADYFRATAAPDEDEEFVLDATLVAEWLRDAERTRDAAVAPDTPEQTPICGGPPSGRMAGRGDRVFAGFPSSSQRP